MAVRWTIKFRSFTGTYYTVSIYDAAYAGTPQELTPAARPFETQEDESDDLYAPIRTQSGYLRIIVADRDAVRQLMPTHSVTERPVVLTDATGAVHWVGFVACEQYDQPWLSPPYEVEVPLIGVLEAMRSMRFTQESGYTSLFDVLRTATASLPVAVTFGTSGDIPMASVCTQNNNWQSYLTPAERLERGTADVFETKTLYEVAEEWAKYYGASLRESGDKIVAYGGALLNGIYMTFDREARADHAACPNETLDALGGCGTYNRESLTRGVRSVGMTFATGRDIAETLFEQDDFLANFEPFATNYEGLEILFNSNEEVVQYRNGEAQISPPTVIGPTSPMSDDVGGFITRLATPLNYVKGSYADYFLIRSDVGYGNDKNAATALRFTIDRELYTAASGKAIICVGASVRRVTNYDVDNLKDIANTGRLFCKLRVGDYWVESYRRSADVPKDYRWSATETICALEVDGGKIAMPSQGAVHAFSANFVGISGFQLALPDDLLGKPVSVQFEIMANAEEEDDLLDDDNLKKKEEGNIKDPTYKVESYRLLLISDLKIYMRQGDNGFLREITPSQTENVIRTIGNTDLSGETGGDCAITTKQGGQFGAGLALDKEDHTYVGVRYDKRGVERRAAWAAQNREVLALEVRRRVLPLATVTDGGRRYAILAQSTQWRDDVTTTRLIGID